MLNHPFKQAKKISPNKKGQPFLIQEKLNIHIHIHLKKQFQRWVQGFIFRKFETIIYFNRKQHCYLLTTIF